MKYFVVKPNVTYQKVPNYKEIWVCFEKLSDNTGFLCNYVTDQ